ncbi:MAG: flagellar motor switch protein FliN [Sedimentisphaerales bacterium]|nr:flagellar motor switch protein FliN [Sedimentisphaerales bacterium]
MSDEKEVKTEDQDSATEAAGPAEDLTELPDFSQMLEEAAVGSIELLRDVELDVKIELGRAEMTIEELLKLQSGSVVELDKLAGDPVDVLINEQLIARGEILVVNDNFCVRINEILPGVTEQFLSD